MRREAGQLPSQPIANPRNQVVQGNFYPLGFQPPLPATLPPKGPHVENAKAISALRSGKVLEDPYKTQSNEENVVEIPPPIEQTEKEVIQDELEEENKEKEKISKDPSSYQPEPPFPLALEPRFRKKKNAPDEEMLRLFK